MKKSTFGAGALALVALLFIGILLLANTLLRGAQLDLTSDRIHTISAGTDHIVKSLKEPVNLYFFFSKQTAAALPQIKAHGTRVRELLEELVSRSNGKLTLKVIDPQPFTDEEDRATELGISSAPVTATGEKLYLGLAATNSTDGKESIPYLDPANEEQLEYDVAKLIHKLSTAKKPVVGWLSSLPMAGDFDMQTGRPRAPWVVYGQVEQLYTVRALEPALTKIDADVDVLVLAHPKDLPPAALYAIDQFALRGGHVLVFVDPKSQVDQSGADPQNPMAAMAADHSSDLAPLLKAWGVAYDRDQVVVDLDLGLSVPLHEGEPPTQHIAFLGLTAQSVSKDIITSGLDTITMFTAGSLKPVKDSKLKFEPLLTTSKEAGTLPTARFSMMSDAQALRDGFKPTGPQVVAARISGNAVSAFPNGPPAGVTAPAGALKASAKPLNVVVIADTDLLLDDLWVEVRNMFGQTVYQPRANNGELVWNAIDNLSGSADLISIRGRAAYSRPFDRVEALRRAADAKFRATEQQLEEQLKETEDQLNKLQSAQPGNDAILTPQAAEAIDHFKQEQIRIRKELRAVNAGLETDIRKLGFKVKLLNILLMPLLVAFVGLAMAYWRNRRRHAIAMLRNQGSGA